MTRKFGLMQQACIDKSRDGAAGGDRTHDPWLRRPILYPLSYSRTLCAEQSGTLSHAGEHLVCMRVELCVATAFPRFEQEIALCFRWVL